MLVTITPRIAKIRSQRPHKALKALTRLLIRPLRPYEALRDPIGSLGILGIPMVLVKGY